MKKEIKRKGKLGDGDKETFLMTGVKLLNLVMSKTGFRFTL